MYLYGEAGRTSNAKLRPRLFGVKALSVNTFLFAAVFGLLGTFGATLLRHSHVVECLQLLTK